jgi:AraC-like DNA-binding protein
LSADAPDLIPVPVRTYVRDAVASMVTAPQPSISRTIRQEVNLILSIDGRPFRIESEGFDVTARAAVIQPGLKHIVIAEDRHMARLAYHPIHPHYRRIVWHVRPEVKVLQRADFAHLDAVLHAAYHEGVDAAAAATVIDGALQVVLRDAPPPRAMDSRILKALHRLDADINTPFEDLARDFELSLSRLSHLFTEETGISYRNLQLWGRLRLAWELVAWRPELSFTQIAHVTGYADSSHLSRVFNQQLGMTPTMVRDHGRLQVIGHKMPAGRHVPGEGDMGPG